MNTDVKRRRNRILAVSGMALSLIFMAGCAENMRDDRRIKPYEGSTFFQDGQSARPLVPGTVARGQLRTDEQFYTGMTGGPQAGDTQRDGGQAGAPGAQGGGNAQEGGQGGNEAQGDDTVEAGGQRDLQNSGGEAAQGDDTVEAGGQRDLQNSGGQQQGGAQGQQGGGQGAGQTGQGGQGTPVDTFPFTVTRELLERGQQQYNVFCAPCHAITGNGDGMIVRRGFSPPPSLHEERLRAAPVGYFYSVITNGFGRMYSYASRIEPTDRWAITAYIRALQLSQNARIEDVPEDQRGQIQGAGQ